MHDEPSASSETRDQGTDLGAQATGRSKFNTGAPDDTHIPWGYGSDRITIMGRDPDWLYAYWEVTEEGLMRARDALGIGEAEGLCALRIYDTTGIEFTGFNARSYEDIPVERTARDRFHHVGRPDSSCHVDLGIVAPDGRFHPVIRSGRATFPRKQPSSDGRVSWLTVHDTSDARRPAAQVSYKSTYHGPVAPIQPASPAGHSAVSSYQHNEHRSAPTPPAQPSQGIIERISSAWKSVFQRQPWAGHDREEGSTYQRIELPTQSESWRTEWQGDGKVFAWFGPLHKLQWDGPVTAMSWQSGPQLASEIKPSRVSVQYVGERGLTFTEEHGRISAVYGPWEVHVRQAEREGTVGRILASWVMHWIEPMAPISEKWETWSHVWTDQFVHEMLQEGASELQRWVAVGASETWMLGGSERLWLGSSEQLLLGASELAWAGASELWTGGVGAAGTWWAGSSEWSFVGASERWLGGSSESSLAGGGEFRPAGASEWVSSGASEQLFSGASELMQTGASELLLMGSSERIWGGASEFALGGASETFALGSSEQLLPSFIPGVYPTTFDPNK